MYIYLIIINTISFISFGIDKRKAILKRQRISENTLLTMSFIGGVLGAILGMILFRHKIRKVKFLIFMPLFLLLWVYILINL